MLHATKATVVSFLLLLSACSDDAGQTHEKEQENQSNPEQAKENTSVSSSDEYVSLGEMSFSFNDETATIKKFIPTHTDLTINKDGMMIRIADAYDRRFKITVMKEKVYKNTSGKYVCGDSDAERKFSVAYHPEYSNNDKLITLMSVEGTLNVESFDPESGEVKLNLQAKIGGVEDLVNQTGKPLKLSMDLRFKKIIRTYNR